MPLLTLFFLELGGPWVGAVGERYYCCVYFLSAIFFHVRTYADASFHITIQARFTNTRFTYVQSSTRRFHDICIFANPR